MTEPAVQFNQYQYQYNFRGSRHWKQSGSETIYYLFSPLSRISALPLDWHYLPASQLLGSRYNRLRLFAFASRDSKIHFASEDSISDWRYCCTRSTWTAPLERRDCQELLWYLSLRPLRRLAAAASTTRKAASTRLWRDSRYSRWRYCGIGDQENVIYGCFSRTGVVPRRWTNLRSTGFHDGMGVVGVV